MNDKKSFYQYLSKGEKFLYVFYISLTVIFAVGFIFISLSLIDAKVYSSTFTLILIAIILIPSFLGRNIRMRGVRRMGEGSTNLADIERLALEEKVHNASARWMKILFKITVIFVVFSVAMTVAFLTFFYFVAYK